MSSSGEGEAPSQGTPKRFVTEKVSEEALTPKNGGSPASRHSLHNEEGGAPVTSPGPHPPATKITVPDGDCTKPSKGKEFPNILPPEPLNIDFCVFLTNFVFLFFFFLSFSKKIPFPFESLPSFLVYSS